MVFLLALSTNVRSPEAIEMALAFTKEKGADLIAVFILDENVSGAIFERLTDIGFIGEKPSEELSAAITAEYEKQAQAQLAEIEQLAREKEVVCRTFIERGDFVEETVAAVARFAADLVIISRTRRSALSRLLIGSAADQLVRRSPCEIKVFEA